MNTEKIFNRFLDRVNYNVVYNSTILKTKDANYFVDHVNKICYCKDDISIEAVFDVAFWLMPNNVLNLVKMSYASKRGENFDFYHFCREVENIIKKYQHIELDCKIDVYKHLHPYMNRDLCNQFDVVVKLILHKIINPDDEWFYPKCKDCVTHFTLECLRYEDINHLTRVLAKTGCVLSGSNALSMYGYVYRNRIKDFDFIVDTKYLDKSILDEIEEENNINKIVGKERTKLENKVKDIFCTTNLYKELSAYLPGLQVKACFIDRISQYDREAKATFILIWDNLEFDLLFRNNIRSKEVLITDSYNMPAKFPNINIKVQVLEDIIYTKRLLGRPKDFQDLICFSAFAKNNITNKCVLNYE